MKKNTHLLGGVAVMGAWCVASTKMGTELPGESAAELLGLFGASLIGSLFPDIDLPTSKIGHMIKPASTAINLTSGHRGVFHAPLPYLIILLLTYLTASYRAFITALAFTLGVMSHLFLDILNASGIPLLWPMKRRVSLCDIKVGSLGEKVVDVALIALMVILAVYLKEGGIATT